MVSFNFSQMYLECYTSGVPHEFFDDLVRRKLCESYVVQYNYSNGIEDGFSIILKFLTAEDQCFFLLQNSKNDLEILLKHWIYKHFDIDPNFKLFKEEL